MGKVPEPQRSKLFKKTHFESVNEQQQHIYVTMQYIISMSSETLSKIVQKKEVCSQMSYLLLLDKDFFAAPQ